MCKLQINKYSHLSIIYHNIYFFLSFYYLYYCLIILIKLNRVSEDDEKPASDGENIKKGNVSYKTRSDVKLKRFLCHFLIFFSRLYCQRLILFFINTIFK